MIQFKKFNKKKTKLHNFLKRSKDISSKLILDLCQLHQQRKPSLLIILTFMKKS